MKSGIGEGEEEEEDEVVKFGWRYSMRQGAVSPKSISTTSPLTSRLMGKIQIIPSRMTLATEREGTKGICGS